MRRDITVETDLPYPVEQVRAALTDPEALSEWVMPVEGFEPVPGQRFRFKARPMPGWDGVINGEILEVDPPQRMVIRWQGSRMRHPHRPDLAADRNRHRHPVPHRSPGLPGPRRRAVRADASGRLAPDGRPPPRLARCVTVLVLTVL
jgi:uncharacterized protein YndB with AHSA1/START domain